MNLNAKTPHGYTAADIAALNHHEEALKLLLKVREGKPQSLKPKPYKPYTGQKFHDHPLPAYQAGAGHRCGSVDVENRCYCDKYDDCYFTCSYYGVVSAMAIAIIPITTYSLLV